MTTDQITAAYPNVAKLESQAGRELLAAVMDQMQALAAENVAARNAVQTFCDVVGGNTFAICEEVGEEGVRAILAAMSATGAMPNTDRFVAEMKAQGVEGFAAHCQQRHSEMMKTEPNEPVRNEAITTVRRAGEFALYFAQQLREVSK